MLFDCVFSALRANLFIIARPFLHFLRYADIIAAAAVAADVVVDIVCYYISDCVHFFPFARLFCSLAHKMLYSLHEWDNKFIYSICLLHLECEFNANTFSGSTYVNVIRIFKELDESTTMAQSGVEHSEKRRNWKGFENYYSKSRERKRERGKRKRSKKVALFYGTETFFKLIKFPCESVRVQQKLMFISIFLLPF